MKKGRAKRTLASACAALRCCLFHLGSAVMVERKRILEKLEEGKHKREGEGEERTLGRLWVEKEERAAWREGEEVEAMAMALAMAKEYREKRKALVCLRMN